MTVLTNKAQHSLIFFFTFFKVRILNFAKKGKIIISKVEILVYKEIKMWKKCLNYSVLHAEANHNSSTTQHSNIDMKCSKSPLHLFSHQIVWIAICIGIAFTFLRHRAESFPSHRFIVTAWSIHFYCG